MNSVANQKVRLSESTTSSDSGVLIEDAASLENDGVVKNINISTTITGNNSDEIKNKCNINRSSSFTSITSSIIENECNNDTNNNQHSDHFTTARDYVEAKNSPDSLRSHNISIISIDEDADSSVIDSDSDIENFASRGELIIQKLGQQTNETKDGLIVVSNNINGNCGDVATPSTSNASRPNIGSIAVQNSTDITFGNKTFYQGPVTIKQFLLENNKWRPNENGGPSDNPAFDSNSDTTNFCEGKKQLPDDSPVRKFIPDKRTAVIIGVILLIFIVVGAIAISTITFLKNKGYNKPGKTLRMVTRSEWIAQPPNGKLDDLEPPVHRVIITHTASENCTTQASCTFHVRFIQTFHMESRQWDDIGYNYLVGGDGAAYVGRGWDKVGAHTKGYNVDSIGIAFIGTFINYAPPKQQLQVAQLLIQEGVKLGKISKNYKLYGHRQLIASESPGEKLYEIIKTWPHWTDQVD